VLVLLFQQTHGLPIKPHTVALVRNVWLNLLRLQIARLALFSSTKPRIIVLLVRQVTSVRRLLAL
jgi:hypothetical protein